MSLFFFFLFLFAKMALMHLTDERVESSQLWMRDDTCTMIVSHSHGRGKRLIVFGTQVLRSASRIRVYQKCNR